VPRFSTVRAPLVSFKSKKRELRAWRSYILVANLPDDRCALQCLASAWKSSVRSLTYKPPCWEVACTVKEPATSQAALVARSRRVTTSATALTRCIIEDPRTTVPPEKETVCLPTIVITPPPPSHIDWASGNAVPTPQNAAHGKLLTVPDRDLKVINRYGRFSSSLGSSFKGRSRLPWSPPTPSKQPSQASVPAKRPQLARRISFVDEEDDEVVDLGPTWSG